jgi:protein SCO1
MMHQRLIGRVALVAVLLGLLGGCQTQEKHYILTGQVLAKNESVGQVSVDNDNIPGFMPAMTMNYAVKDPEGLQQVQLGDRITADVVVQKESGNYWLEHVTITDQSARGSVSAAAKPHELLPGEKVPDVPLVNQDGKTLHLADFKGKAVLLTFIYTRCPLPTFCPLISSEFAEIHNDLAHTPPIYEKTHLVSVSLDPNYDTAPVLRKYGLAYLKDDASGFQQWDFVSTNPAELQKLASAFGLEYYEQNNQISHSMSTILIAPDGSVKQIWPGNDWKTSKVLAALKDATS